MQTRYRGECLRITHSFHISIFLFRFEYCLWEGRTCAAVLQYWKAFPPFYSCFCELNMQLPGLGFQQCLFCQVCAHDNQHINSHKHRAAAQLEEHSCCCLPWAAQENILYRAVFEPGCSPPIINSTVVQTQTPRMLGGSSATPQLNAKIFKSWVGETEETHTHTKNSYVNDQLLMCL